ncbi:hypothetical protein Barb6_01400 [Bacteroidales bacterium Barb6]|nr:hypothetical protein Barb6_01400 [Bacteroidales bacterium Barb6]
MQFLLFVSVVLPACVPFGGKIGIGQSRLQGKAVVQVAADTQAEGYGMLVLDVRLGKFAVESGGVHQQQTFTAQACAVGDIVRHGIV